MSAKREKERRRIARAKYMAELRSWERREPPKLCFISHWLWKKERPVAPK